MSSCTHTHILNRILQFVMILWLVWKSDWFRGRNQIRQMIFEKDFFIEMCVFIVHGIYLNGVHWKYDTGHWLYFYTAYQWVFRYESRSVYVFLSNFFKSCKKMLVCPPKFSEFSQRSRNNNYDFFDWNFWDVWRTNSNFGGGWICCRARALRARSSFFVLNVQNATRSSSLIDFRRCQQELYFFSLIQRLLRPTKFLKSSLDFTILLRSFAIRLSANSRINPRLKVSMLSKIDSGTALRVRVAYGAEPSPRFLQFWTSDSSLGSFCNIEKRVWVVACISMIGENFFMLAIVHNWRIFSTHALFYCAFF